MLARAHTTRPATGISVRLATMVAAMVFTASAVVLSCTLFCSPALADTVRRATYDHVRISALVEPDGDLRIRERFTVSYKGNFHGMYWVIDDSYPEILSAGEYVAGEFVPYKHVFTSKGEPGTYSISTPPEKSYLKRVDLHIDKTDETAEYLLEYRMSKEACRWADASELRWEFVGDAWDDVLHDIVCDLYVARPEDTGTWAGENVFAWLYHSALTTVIEDIEDSVVPPELTDGDEEVHAAHVRWSVDEAHEGRLNMVTVLFPADWLFERGAYDDPKRAEVLQDMEQEIAKSAKRKAERGAMLGPLITFILAVVVVPFLFILELSRHGINVGRHRSGWSDGGSSGGGGSGGGGGGHGGGSY